MVCGGQAAARPRRGGGVRGPPCVDWGQLDTMMDRVAASLQRDGVAPNQSIAICAANSLEYAAVFLGALRAGVVVAPMPTGALASQLAGMTADSGARHLFVDAAAPAFESGARRIVMDASGPGSLQDWLVPDGTRPRPVTVKPDERGP